MASKKKKIYYLTFSYYPSGVFKSQIFDVIKLMRTMTDQDVRLISFFSVRVYFKCRKWVKKDMPDALVLPILFGMKRWEWHSKLLNLFVSKKSFFIGRNPMGSKISLNYSPNVIYDGRSALSAEVREYDMALKGALNQSFIDAEKHVVHHAHHRMAVSGELIEYWEKEFGYTGKDVTIVPCSLAYSHNQPLPQRPTNKMTRLLFSGGGSPWQSQKDKHYWITNLLETREDIEFVFLTKMEEFIENLQAKFPGRVIQKWLEPEQVFKELAQADYGILLREDNITNRVSSPVKFAEYLNAGLNVIISPCIVDFAKFVEDHACGVVLQDVHQKIDLHPLSQEQRLKNHHLAEENFSKNTKNIISRYQKIIDIVNE